MTTIKEFIDNHGGYEAMRDYRLTNGKHIWRLAKSGSDYGLQSIDLKGNPLRVEYSISNKLKNIISIPGLEVLPNTEYRCLYVAQFEGEDPFISEDRFGSAAEAKHSLEKSRGVVKLVTLIKLEHTAVKKDRYPVNPGVRKLSPERER